jgi:hypothetical protein
MSVHVKKVVLELLVTMISHLGMEDLNTMYREIVPWLCESGNANRQKRAYQVNQIRVETRAGSCLVA